MQFKGFKQASKSFKQASKNIPIITERDKFKYIRSHNENLLNLFWQIQAAVLAWLKAFNQLYVFEGPALNSAFQLPDLWIQAHGPTEALPCI